MPGTYRYYNERGEIETMDYLGQFRVERLENLVRDFVNAPCATCDPWLDEGFSCPHFNGSECSLRVRAAHMGIVAD